jgi:hypothetical protein
LRLRGNYGRAGRSYLLKALRHAPFIESALGMLITCDCNRAPCDRETLQRSRSQEMIMEQTHWLGRKRASLNSAERATSSEARLIHYDLAGRYSLKALLAETLAIDLADALPPPIYANRLTAARNA